MTPPYYTYNHSARVVAGEACPTGSSSISGLAFYLHRRHLPVDLQRRAVLRRLLAQLHLGDARGATACPTRPTSSRSVGRRRSGESDVSGPAATSSTPAQRRPAAPDPLLGRQSAADRGRPGQARPKARAADGQLHGGGFERPRRQALTYAWDLDGDGAFDDCTPAAPAVHLQRRRAVTVRLRVTDASGLFDVAAVLVSVDNTAPTATIDSPAARSPGRSATRSRSAGAATDPKKARCRRRR